VPKIKYQDFTFRKSTLVIIEQANEILANYRAQGYNLTLRQLFYQFVSRGLIANKDTEYKKLGSIINDARLAGIIDWNAIVDRTRSLRDLSHWESPSDIIESAAYGYHYPKWSLQEYQPEVWVEKDALIGVVEQICNTLDVPCFSCRGYTSQTAMWDAAQRLKRHKFRHKIPYVIHLGDHDPSGMDMTRDITERLSTFGGYIEVNRIALNWDQIQQYSPPPNPAKLTDARAEGYIAEYGEESWELDALEPSVIADLIEETVLGIRDEEAWAKGVQIETKNMKLLAQASKRWTDVAEYLTDLDSTGSLNEPDESDFE
jgi:hypothetical protein